MPDITMCKGGDCVLKEKCYRYTARAWEYQTYFTLPPIIDQSCDYFWDEKEDGDD